MQRYIRSSTAPLALCGAARSLLLGSALPTTWVPGNLPGTCAWTSAPLQSRSQTHNDGHACVVQLRAARRTSVHATPYCSRERIGIFPLHMDPPTAEHTAIFRKLLSERAYAKLIVVPHTRYAVSIARSVHLAALATLATREFDGQVEVDLTSLEHPDASMPYLSRLLCRFPNAELVTWLHDAKYLAEYGCVDLLTSGERACTFVNTVEHAKDLPTGHAANDQHLLPPGFSPSVHTAITVLRTSGNDVRRLLFEESLRTGAKVPQPASAKETFLTPSVRRYVEGHHLYEEHRIALHHHVTSAAHDRTPLTGQRPRSRGIGGTSTVVFAGPTPRLELLFDPSNSKAVAIYESLKHWCAAPGEAADLLVPIGGDGYMMHCVRQHWRRFVPFFGVNAGTVGYLLNDASTLNELVSAPLRLYQVPMLYVEATRPTSAALADGSSDSPPREGATKITGEAAFSHTSAPTCSTISQQDNEKTCALAFNDAWVERASGQTALLNVKINGETRITRVRGDGVLVSTASGSTAYALALGASPLPIAAPILQLVGSNCVYPARWKPVHLNLDVHVDLQNIDDKKRPIIGFADSVPLGPVSKLEVRCSRVAGVQIAYCESCDIQAKLYKLQFPVSA